MWTVHRAEWPSAFMCVSSPAVDYILYKWLQITCDSSSRNFKPTTSVDMSNVKFLSEWKRVHS